MSDKQNSVKLLILLFFMSILCAYSFLSSPHPLLRQIPSLCTFSSVPFSLYTNVSLSPLLAHRSSLSFSLSLLSDVSLFHKLNLLILSLFLPLFFFFAICILRIVILSSISPFLYPPNMIPLPLNILSPLDLPSLLHSFIHSFI